MEKIKPTGTTAPFERLGSVGYQAYLTGCLCVLSRDLCAHRVQQIGQVTGQKVSAAAVNQWCGILMQKGQCHVQTRTEGTTVDANDLKHTAK